jgi:hypothetical protein
MSLLSRSLAVKAGLAAAVAILAVTRQRYRTSGSPRPGDHLAGLREHHGVAGAGSSTGGGAGRWRRR